VDTKKNRATMPMSKPFLLFFLPVLGAFEDGSEGGVSLPAGSAALARTPAAAAATVGASVSSGVGDGAPDAGITGGGSTGGVSREGADCCSSALISTGALTGSETDADGISTGADARISFGISTGGVTGGAETIGSAVGSSFEASAPGRNNPPAIASCNFDVSSVLVGIGAAPIGVAVS